MLTPVTNQPSPTKALAVAPSLSRYPRMTPGPRARSNPWPPSGTSSIVVGSTTRSWVPGTGWPTLPRTFCIQTEGRQLNQGEAAQGKRVTMSRHQRANSYRFLKKQGKKSAQQSI